MLTINIKNFLVIRNEHLGESTWLISKNEFNIRGKYRSPMFQYIKMTDKSGNFIKVSEEVLSTILFSYVPPSGYNSLTLISHDVVCDMGVSEVLLLSNFLKSNKIKAKLDKHYE